MVLLYYLGGFDTHIYSPFSNCHLNSVTTSLSTFSKLLTSVIIHEFHLPRLYLFHWFNFQHSTLLLTPSKFQVFLNCCILTPETCYFTKLFLPICLKFLVCLYSIFISHSFQPQCSEGLLGESLKLLLCIASYTLSTELYYAWQIHNSMNLAGWWQGHYSATNHHYWN